MKNKFLNLSLCLLFILNNLWAEPANVKVVKGILVSPSEPKQLLIKGIPVTQPDTRPVVRGILVRPPEPVYQETVYYEESDPVADALIGTTIFLGLTALFCGVFSDHHGHGYYRHHGGYHHGYRHGYRHGYHHGGYHGR